MRHLIINLLNIFSKLLIIIFCFKLSACGEENFYITENKSSSIITKTNESWHYHKSDRCSSNTPYWCVYTSKCIQDATKCKPIIHYYQK